MVLGDRAYYSAVDRGDRLRRNPEADEGDLLNISTNAYLLFGIPLTAGFQLFVCKRPIKNPMTRLRLLAPILVVVFPAGCGGEEEELTVPTEVTETDEDTTEVTQAPPEGGVFFAIRCS